MEFIIIAAVIIILFLVILTNISVVQQSKAYVIERLGAFQTVWGVGMHFKVPFIDRIARKVSLKEQVLDYPPQPVITKDNVTMQIDTVVYFQITLFFLVSAGLLACLRPMVRRFVKPGLTATNVDSVIGTRGYVLSDVDNENASGRVKLGGMEWTARSTSGAVIPKGTLVQVDKVEGVKAFVSPAEVSAEVK